jgi:hypothetical protein
MLLHLAFSVSFVAQVSAAPARAIQGTPPVRVWLPDTLLHPGARARVYVRLESTAHLMVLHADAGGRIRVLFPDTPTGSTLVPGGEAFEVTEGSATGAFPVLGPGSGLVLAIWSAAPLDFAGLDVSGRWDYDHALLFQPTAGNLFAALLDIADRVSAGRPYQYDQAGYRTPGTSMPRLASGDDVCLECFTAHASTPAASPSLTTITTVVDCSNTTLVNSFCGVQDNRAYVTEQAPPQTLEVSSYPVVLPVYVPIFIPSHRHFARPRHEPSLPAIALDPRLRTLPGRITPPPPRRRPPIVVRQPYAPSRPRRRDAEPLEASSGMAPRDPVIPPVSRPTSTPPAASAPAQRATASASLWASLPVPLFAQPPRRDHLATSATTTAAAFKLPLARTVLVPSRGVIRSLQARRP